MLGYVIYCHCCPCRVGTYFTFVEEIDPVFVVSATNWSSSVVPSGWGSQARSTDAELGESPRGAAADTNVRGPAADALVLSGA